MNDEKMKDEKMLEKEKQAGQGDEWVRKLVFTAIFAALTYVVFAFLSIPVPTPGGKVQIHLGNAFLVLGVLLLGPIYGSLGGALGLTIADLIDPVYITEAPITFVIKFTMGVLVGILAHKLGHISTTNDNKKATTWVLISTICGLLFNTIFDPLLRYFYKMWILGKPAAEVTFAINFGVTLLNSIGSAIIVVALYLALRAPLKKNGLFFRL